MPALFSQPEANTVNGPQCVPILADQFLVRPIHSEQYVISRGNCWCRKSVVSSRALGDPYITYMCKLLFFPLSLILFFSILDSFRDLYVLISVHYCIIAHAHIASTS